MTTAYTPSLIALVRAQRDAQDAAAAETKQRWSVALEANRRVLARCLPLHIWRDLGIDPLKATSLASDPDAERPYTRFVSLRLDGAPLIVSAQLFQGTGKAYLRIALADSPSNEAPLAAELSTDPKALEGNVGHVARALAMALGRHQALLEREREARESDAEESEVTP